MKKLQSAASRTYNSNIHTRTGVNKMKTITQSELNDIVKKHGFWLCNRPDGEQADFRNYDLRGMMFDGAFLPKALFDNDILDNASFTGATLNGASFVNASLTTAIMIGSRLETADFNNACLRGAVLNKSMLVSSCMTGANLIDASLVGATMTGTDLNDVKSMWDTTGNGSEIITLRTNRWTVNYTKTHMQIGCKKFLIDEWWGLVTRKLPEWLKTQLNGGKSGNRF